MYTGNLIDAHLVSLDALSDFNRGSNGNGYAAPNRIANFGRAPKSGSIKLFAATTAASIAPWLKPMIPSKGPDSFQIRSM